MITLLLGLFIILYAISKIDSKKYEKVITAMSDVFGSKTKIGLVTNKAQIQPPKPVDSPLKAELAKLIQRSGYSKSIRLDENKRGITIHILDDILFSSGSADLTAGSLKVLNKIAAILRELPNDIRVEGHTDDVPISTKFFPSNWHLSVARALNTAYYLIHDEGLKPDKVSIVGYSKYKPIALNDSPEGRAENRRVDIVIIKNKAL